MITLAALDNLPPCNLGSTQGQWWDNSFWLPGTERRVELVAAQMGHHLWTASVRKTAPGGATRQWFFVTLPGSTEALAVFDTLAEREAWLQARWEG